MPFVLGGLTAYGRMFDSQRATAFASLQLHSHLGSQIKASNSDTTGDSIEAKTTCDAAVVEVEVVDGEVIHGSKATVVVGPCINVVDGDWAVANATVTEGTDTSGNLTDV